MNRRDLLKSLGFGLGAIQVTDTLGFSAFQVDKPVRIITLGAGNRGNAYGKHILEYADKIEVVGVAEPIAIRNERYAEKHQIPAKNRFATWEHVFDVPKFADAILISTPDNLHFAPAMKALEMGYHLLLEKPIAPTIEECQAILAQAKKYNRIVAVCHVLRYTPYFKKMKQVADSGILGKILSIQHLEPISFDHFSHSYVRGNWHNSRATTPLILAKSCHDLDILRWVANRPCKSINAYGSLEWFKAENAPENSAERCLDCAVEPNCAFSALKTYHRERKRIRVFDLPPESPEQHGDLILEALKTSNYGRCVYRCQNDQPDHYVASMQFEGNLSVNFSMEAFTSYEGRRTRMMGTKGDLVGDMKKLMITDFLTNKTTDWEASQSYDSGMGHAGGDAGIVWDFAHAVAKEDATLLTSTIDASIESHVMGFMAEKSRIEGRRVDF